MDKRQLHSKIVEILVFTQFDAWVEPNYSEPTAEEINTKKQRAIDYYLGKTKDPKKLPTSEQIKFRHIVQMQSYYIMQELND